MATYLYVIETNGVPGIENTIHAIFDALLGPNFSQFKCFNSWGYLNVPNDGNVGPIPWVLIMAVATTTSGVNKANLDAIFNGAMQQLKNTYPNNLVVGISFQVDLLPILI